jgi:outer membrane protein OmpA-like peptidoglycan-associated protein
MRFRNLLLTSTSLALLLAVPISLVQAQDATDPALVKAFEAFQGDQSDANKQALTEACITAGFQSLDDCIAALTGQKPVEQQASSEPPAESSAEPPATEQPSSEEAQPSAEETQPSSEEAPPPSSSEEAVPPPSSSEEAPAPSSEEAPAPSSEEQPAPASSEAPPPDEASSSEQAAPPQSSEAPAEQQAAPSSEQAAPESSAEQPAPSSEQPAPPAKGDALADLTAAVDLYNQGAGELDAGNADGQAKVDKGKAEIDKICKAAGFDDIDACLAQFGLALNPLPAKQSEQLASSEQQPTSSAEQPAASSEQPTSELPQASEQVSPSAVEVLPPDVSQEAAPILDSAKDQTKSSEQPSSEQPPAEPPAPPPADDKAAQQDLQPPPKEEQSALTEKGQEKPSDFTFIEPTVPDNNPDVKIIQPPKNDTGGFVFQIGINIYINNPQQERDRFYDRDRGDKILYEDLSRGRVRETIIRANGTRVVTIYSRHGDVLQRSKILPDGREIILASFDPRDQDVEDWRDPGDDLPPLVLNIPARDYVLDADVADEDEVELFLEQPPVEKVRQIYTIDEVKRSARLRDSVRRLEIGNLTFDTGKATIARSQVDALSKVANAMLKLLDKNPGEVFLIEGHTDAVGSDVSNLVLSDQRAATVARILSDFYEIPPENLVTQGYGERYLKVQTEGDEPLNRRVTVKRVTPLVSYEASAE